VAFFDFSRNKGQRCLFDGLKWRLLSLFASSLMSKRSPRPACAQAAPFFHDQPDLMPEVLIALSITIAAYRYADGPKPQLPLLGSAVRMTI
jgi:hypothetical protein